MTVIPYETPDRPPPDFPDRRAALTAAGTVAVILGMLSGAMALLMLVLVLLSRGGGGAARPMGDVVGQITVFAGAAAFLIWVGVGSIRIRRWVRPVMLAVGWTWLVMGTLFLVFYAFSLLRMFEAARAASAGTTAPGAMAGGMAITGGVVLVIYTLLPAVAVWFYHRPGVRRTLEHYDRKPRWTDDCPIPVLALSLWLVVTAAATAAAAFARPVLPLFGVTLVGLPAVAGFLAVAALLLWLAHATFRLRLAGWWAAIVLLALYVVSYMITVFTGDLLGAYQRAGYTPDEIEDLAYGISHRMAALWFILFWAGALCYLLYVRRFFTAARSGGPTTPTEPISAAPL